MRHLKHKKTSKSKDVMVLKKIRDQAGFITYVPVRKVSMETCMSLISKYHKIGRDSDFCYRYNNGESEIWIRTQQNGTILIDTKQS